MGPGGFRQFQRQMTATQLLSHESPAAYNNSNNNNNKQRAALLGPARGLQTLGLDPALASSMSSLGSSGGGGITTGGGGSARSPRRQPEADADQHAQQPNRKAAKGKRIISRMLSISTIHSSLGSSGGSGDGGSGGGGGPSTLTSDIGGGSQTTMGTSGSLASKNSSSLEQAPADKIDSSLTRSRSSSCSSETPSPRTAGQQQQPPELSRGESIQCLCFLDWTKAAASTSSEQQPPSNNNKSLGSIDGFSAQACQLALWLGTSQGSVLLLALSMPDNDDNRILQLQSVDAEPIPQATIKLQGPIRCLGVFTSELVRPQPPSPPLAHSASGSLETLETPFEARNKSPAAPPLSRPKSAQPPLSVAAASSSSSSSAAVWDQQQQQQQPPVFLAIVSERQARVYQMLGPDQMMMMMVSTKSSSSSSSLNQNCLAKIDFSSGVGPIKCATLMQWRQPNETCLATQTTGGQLQVHSLPQLRPLIEAQLEAAQSSQVVFSRNGHALYRPSPNEIAKFTLNAQYRSLVSKAPGRLYVAREMPELPRSNFFKSLLGSVGTSLIGKQCDRDELFGSPESSTGGGGGKLASQASSRIKQMGGLDRLRSATTGGLASEMRMAREGLDERGEKLSEIEDRTLQMMNQSENYSQTSNQLAQKFKDKKWYQF